MLVFIDLVQDIDVLLPVILALNAQPDLAAKVVVSRWLERESPRVSGLLRARRIPFSYVRRRQVIDDAAPSLRGIVAVMAASESSHPAHAAGHALARRAAHLGLATYALQHGLENVGLIGVDAQGVEFASRAVFCWFPAALTPAEMPPATRAKLDHVGRPWLPAPADAPEETASYDLGVFENLHWDRYGEAEREAFGRGLLAVAEALPHLRILLRAHPAGQWSRQLRHELAPFANITAPSAIETRGSLRGPAEILRGINRVITTPSTVALDAALAGRPVALAAAGGTLYDPLPVLNTPGDWVAFASAASAKLETLDQFRSRVLVASDGAAAIVDRLRRDLTSAEPRSHG